MALTEETMTRVEPLDGLVEVVDRDLEQAGGRLREVDKRFETLETQLRDGLAAVSEQLVEQRVDTQFGYTRLDQSLHTLSGGLARLERKLDRVLALCVESRARNRQ
jgi:septal ring factor EnvC (AmiA/AmiB activator)